jgi:hypothetical protein
MIKKIIAKKSHCKKTSIIIIIKLKEIIKENTACIGFFAITIKELIITERKKRPINEIKYKKLKKLNNFMKKKVYIIYVFIIINQKNKIN